MDFTPQRIVSLQPSATSILARLGLLDRVVACTRYCRDVCPDIAARPHMIVADSWSAQSAQILAAKPDLVIASVPYQLEAVAEILKAGVPFLALSPHTLRDVYADIAKIAALIGAPDRAAALIAAMQKEVEALRSRVDAGDSPAQAPRSGAAFRPRLFCEEWGKPIIVSQPWVAELVSAAGGEFLGTPGDKTTAEAVAAQHPDVIVAAWCGAGDRVPLEKIVRERGWSETPAARHARVYCIRDELLNTPGPALIDGLHALACALHPEVFGEHHPGLRRILTTDLHR
jgi:iron complex transport system substrate-binding protein